MPYKEKPVFMTHASGEIALCPEKVEGPTTPRLLMTSYT